MRKFLKFVSAFVVLILGSCGAAPAGADTAIYVTSNGWHTGLVLPRAAIALENVPEVVDFPKAPYLEFGWGDAEFYPAEEPPVTMTLRAALVPTAAVIHVIDLAAEPGRVFPKAEVLRFRADQDTLERQLAHIHKSFDRSGGRCAVATGLGLYPNNRFYPAIGRFHIGNTCNSWPLAGWPMPACRWRTARSRSLKI